MREEPPQIDIGASEVQISVWLLVLLIAGVLPLAFILGYLVGSLS